MNHKKNKKDISIELLRVIACFFVICIHLGVGATINGSVSKGAAFLVCLRADAVAIFWMITGAFLFKRDAYDKLLKNTFLKVAVPMLLLILFIFLFEGFIFNGESLLESFSHTPKEIFDAVSCILLRWGTPVAYSGHLWYLFAYILIMVIFPIMKAFVDRLEERKKEKVFIGASLIFLLVNDLSQNTFANFSHSVTGALLPAFIFVVLGHILYKNRDNIPKWLKWYHFLIIFFATTVLRTLTFGLGYKYMGVGLDNVIIYWYSAFGVISAGSLFYFANGITKSLKSRAIENTILLLGSFTFMIYLVHGIVIGIFNKYGVLDTMKEHFVASGNFFGLCAYYALGGGCVFILCFIVSMLIDLMKKILKCIFSGIRNNSLAKTKS